MFSSTRLVQPLLSPYGYLRSSNKPPPVAPPDFLCTPTYSLMEKQCKHCSAIAKHRSVVNTVSCPVLANVKKINSVSAKNSTEGVCMIKHIPVTILVSIFHLCYTNKVSIHEQGWILAKGNWSYAFLWKFRVVQLYSHTIQSEYIVTL